MNHAKTVQKCLYFSKLSLLQKQDFLTLTKNQPSTETVIQEATTVIGRGL